jgi:hypothetical protein
MSRKGELTMAYKPNFYQAQNIVGYTGKIGESPTVYFMDNEHYGHITQAHKCPFNVGREPIRPLITSPAKGTDINGTILTLFYRHTNDPVSNKLVEWYEQVYTPPRIPGARRGAVVGMGYKKRIEIHPSRNKFIECDDKTKPALEGSLKLEELKKLCTADGLLKFQACCGAANQGKPWSKCGPECPF